MEQSKSGGNGRPPLVESEPQDVRDQEMAVLCESFQKMKLNNSSVHGHEQTTLDPKTIMATFLSVLTMLRVAYLDVNLHADEREETLVLVNHIVNDGQLNAEDEKSTSVKALRDIINQNSLDSLLHSLKECGGGGMAKLRHQLAIIRKLFLRMSAVDKEHARTLLKGFLKEDVCSVLRLPMELLVKIMLYVTSFADRIRLAATCRVMRSAIIDTIRQMSERVVMIDMDRSFTTVNGVRVPHTVLHPITAHRACIRAETDCIGALVAFAQPTTLLVRPLQRWALHAPEAMAMWGMVALTAGVQTPALSSSATVHLCCRSLAHDNIVDLLAQLDDVSRARITSVCCADYRYLSLTFFCYSELLPILPNCRKMYLDALDRHLFNHSRLDFCLNMKRVVVYEAFDVLNKCCSADGHRGKTLELHISLDEGYLWRLQRRHQADRSYTRHGTIVRFLFGSSRYCSFDCSDLLEHRL